MAVQNGVVMAFGVLYLPLVREFAGGRGLVATLQSGVVLLGGLGAPLAGAALDRWGPRRLFQGGAVLAAAGLLVASQARSLPMLGIAYGVIAGAGLSALGSAPNMVVVAQWFPRRRGRAISLADLGTPVGTVALVPLAQWCVGLLGWRATLQILAALLLAVLLPANASQRLPPSPKAGSAGVDARSVRAAARTGIFWWLAALRFFTGVGFTLVNTHAVAAAIEAGIPPLTAAAAISGVAAVSVAGRLLSGWLVDRVGPARTLSVSFGSGLLGLGALAWLGVTREPGWLVAFVACYGLAQGSGGIVATASATAAFHGPAVGVITGWIAMASGPGEALGAWAGGALHDWSRGYGEAMLLSAAALVVGVGATWRAQRSIRPSRVA